MFKAAILLLVAICSASSAYAQTEPESRLSILGLEDDEDVFPDDEGILLDEEETRTVGNMGGVLLAIKKQIKDILAEFGWQIFGYIKNILHHFKVKLLKKLGLYTLKDVFHVVFDGVADFVVDTDPAVVYYKEMQKPTEPPYSSEDFSLASLFKYARR